MKRLTTFWIFYLLKTALVSAQFNNLVWFDEFNYSGAPSEERWTFDLGNGCPDLCGWGNNELQFYTQSSKNVRVEDGSLIIESHNEPIETMSYSSARLLTKNLGEWKYGRIEVRAKLPTGKGTWSAIWMLPTLDRPMQWPQDGEIDIMEHVGFNTGTIYGTIHTSSNNLISGTQKSDSIKTSNVSQFHVYAIEWDEKSIRWFTDRYEYHRVERLPDDGDSEWPFDKPFHLIINLAVGGNWGGKMGIEENDWPQRMVVDYVRVFQ